MPIGVTRIGEVRFWNVTGNYGFIAADFGDRDVYFHGTSTLDREWLPSPGQRVSFRLIREHDGRLRAARVAQLADDARAASK